LRLAVARFEAARARRHSDAVDPDNLSGAAEPEHRWNDRLLAMRVSQTSGCIGREPANRALSRQEKADAARQVFDRDGRGGTVGATGGTSAAVLPKGERGRKPIELELMLRIYLLQQWYGLADEAIEECCTTARHCAALLASI
jgi:Transposase domain (DUF772)